MQRLKLIYGLGLILLTCSLSVAYEGWTDRGEVALNQAILDLTSDMTIVCLAAHPDDEDGATLAYYRKKHGVRTAVVLATRGEGGQNQIGPELYEELGVIRAYETQAAARIYGTEVYNLNKRDFGYSKSAEETFSIWGHEDSLRRLVRAIREIRPDVIITNHDTEHGHGHHQAVGIIALEAFDAAADPNRFHEQIEDGLDPWQVKRLFLRCGKDDADVVINVGEYDQARGYSYAQIAGEGLKMHRSQGMGGNVERGNVYRYYKLIRSSTPTSRRPGSLLDDLTVKASPSGFTEDAVEAVSISHDKVAEAVIEAVRALQDSDMDISGVAGFSLRSLRSEKLEIAAAKALDLYLTVEPEDNILTRGQKFTVHVSLTNCGHHVIEDAGFDLLAPQGWAIENHSPATQKVEYSETATAVFDVIVAEDAPLTLPYADHLYDDSFMKPLIHGISRYKVYDVPLSITSGARIDVTSDIELHILPETIILPLSHKTIRCIVNTINRTPGRIEGRIELFPPSGWDTTVIGGDLSVSEDEQAFAAFDVTIPSSIAAGDFPLEAKAVYKTPSGVMDSTIASGTVRAIDVKVADDLYVGYVKSYDNTIEQALKQLNVRSSALEADDLRFGDLSIYDTIILDIRAYLVRQDLVESNQRLLDYVRDGGNLVVMYHKTYEWNGRQYAPYKLILSHDRVTVEEAPIHILVPDHPIFVFPNRITDSDWEDWIQERGLYFPSEWATEYTELLSCNDPGEKPLRGGYLVAQYGKGTYIYTSYVWYRQLQNLNPGAFRNFANMISLPKYAGSPNEDSR